MNKAKTYSERLDKLKWFWCIPAAIMYAATQIPFGKATAFGLALCFGASFYLICSRGRMHIISEDIVKDIKDSLRKFGQEDSVFEVKGFSFGLVVRVYLYRATFKTPACTKAIMERLSKGWYKNLVWVAQVVDVAEESQFKSLQKELDQALIDTLESERGKKE
ncbi:MAG: hypothetical protein IKT62_02115 [Firmicutes bacterium]|nr:hypothetical protein [Bacillota bacterium]